MNIFSRDYEEIGSSDKGLILKNSGKVKILWGRKFIDLLDSNGNLNANVQSLIKKIPSKNSMKDDGFYYCDGILYAKVGNNILELTFESGNTYVSFMVEQEATSEQKYTALKNIGFIYENQSEYNIYPTNGIIYIEDSQTLFIVKDGVLSKYTASIPNPFTELLIILKNVENELEGALVIIGEGVKNGLIFDALQIYMKGKVPIFETDKEFLFLVGNKKILTINLLGLETEGIKSPEADETKGYRIYEEDGKYILDIDRINVREGLDAGNNIGVMDYEDLIIAPASDFDYLKFSNPRWSDSDYDDIAISLSLYNRIVTIGYNLGKHLEKRLDDIEKRLDDLEDLVGSKPSSINIDYCPSSISVGDTYTLSYTLGPSGSEDYEYVRVIWDSEDSDIISIYSLSGIIYGEAVGTTTITATLYVDGNERATTTCEIEVAIIPVTSILGIPSYLSIYENDSETLTAYVDPSNASNQWISWDVDRPNVVSLSSTTLSDDPNTIEAIGNVGDTCEITVSAQDTSNSASASCIVTIIEQPQLPDPYITIDGYNGAIEIGEEKELRMIYHDSYGNTLDVTWANGWDLSECDTFLELKTGTLGTFRGIGNGGNGYLSASYLNLSDRIIVAVTTSSLPSDPSLSSITLSHNYTSMIYVGDTFGITVTANYSDNSHVDITNSNSLIFEYSNSNVLTNRGYDSNSLLIIFEGSSPGTTNITVKYNNKPATLQNVTVAASITVTSFMITPNNLDFTENLIGLNYALQLTASVHYSDDTIDSTGEKVNGITWTSSDPTVATVNEGLVTALHIGTATITAVCSNISRTCNVSVTSSYVAVTGITLDKSSLNFTGLNLTGNLIATVNPQNATDKSVTWSSDPSGVVRVEGSGSNNHIGNITTIGTGTTTVKVTTHDGGKQDSCTIYVTTPSNPKYITGITLSTSSMMLETIGTGSHSIEDITATISPSEYNSWTSWKWESSNPDVARVQKNEGNTSTSVTAFGSGECNITLTIVSNGNTVVGTCHVTVE